jgi:Zn-dependent protease
MFGLICGLVAMPVLLLETAVLRQQSITIASIGNLLIYPLLVMASIVLHEAGHALVARAVGLRVLRIELGLSRRVARWRWGKLRLQLNTIPLFGLTVWGPGPRPVRRWQVWLTTLAGPITTLAIAAVTLAVAGLNVTDVLWPSGAVAGGLAVAHLLAFQNVWMLVRNLLPFKVNGYTSDGMQLLRLPFAPRSDLEILRLLPPMLDAADHMEARQFDAAQRALDMASEIAPGSLFVRCDLATLALLRSRHAEARELFVALAAEPELPPGLRWLVLNNLAWADYMLDDPELRDEADRSSREALAKAKRSPHAIGTRGAVLGWLGEHNAALDPLYRSFAHHSSPQGRATTACSLAISWAALRDVDHAEHWLARARKIDAGCLLLDRAATAIARAREKRSAPVVAAASDPAG